MNTNTSSARPEAASGRSSASRPVGFVANPSAVELLGEAPEAIEVELTAKAARRLDAILRAWRRAVARRQFASVRYVCSPGALPYVERGIKRVRATVIRIEPMEGADAMLESALEPVP
jgi:hypothetical protein